MKTILERGKRMKKKKGFTLIELLAVIVILAIIALIAVPIVMNIISKANKSAFKDSAYGILKAGESYYTSELLEDAEGITEDVTFTFPNNIEGLEFQGSKPTGGTMTVRKDGKISMAIHNGKHCVTKGFEDEDIQISDDLTNCGSSNGGNVNNTLADLVVNAETSVSTSTSASPLCINKGYVCEAGTLFTIKVNESQTYNFYVLNDNGNKVDLIMDRNLVDDVEWINAEDYGNSTVKNDKGPLTALKVLKERTSGWTNIPIYTYTLENDADRVNGSNTYNPITATSTSGGNLVENVRARLPKFGDIIVHTDNNDISYPDVPVWLKNDIETNGEQGYWLSTVYSSEFEISAWTVSNQYSYGQVALVRVSPSMSLGLRPVITLSK